jgi:hypothetical protein
VRLPKTSGCNFITTSVKEWRIASYIGMCFDALRRNIQRPF